MIDENEKQKWKFKNKNLKLKKKSKHFWSQNVSKVWTLLCDTEAINHHWLDDQWKRKVKTKILRIKKIFQEKFGHDP